MADTQKNLRPMTSHSCATTERSQKKVYNQLWDQMMRKSTADGFHHSRPRKLSPFRYQTNGDWSILMGRTSPDNRCGSHIKRNITNDTMRTSFYKTDQFLSPDKIGYNAKTNDGQFRVIKVNKNLWQSDVLNQKQIDVQPQQKNKYFHQTLRTEQSNGFQEQTNLSQTKGATYIRKDHYNKYVATNQNRYHGGEGYLHQKRDSKQMVKLINQEEQRQLSQTREEQRTRNQNLSYTNAFEDYKKRIDDKTSFINIQINNDKLLNNTFQFTQTSPKNNNMDERGRQTSLGFTRTTDSQGFNMEKLEKKYNEPFNQKVQQRSGRKMPQYMKDLFESKKFKDSLQY
ncbi:hypothetical protein TTHERM_00388270 (macronuclear) [Tetrahymena thermophila SB210]|uniref:Uncharacterized protein n=1 Tax=Tetrahymena thermophila (strain SB210) TaxID=312017 RepID=Q23RG2_TETTS|nr:hypothetical protein TTHERM_00388270 [Tetrahymena thermophila SB210]EAR99086.3 hypothetical protein TTHERM_00388270 [Tetrahymena thermophila SB210]|eukprot:XP_001019331.3 hypothetical protein TTHERM_00388270 [Tetrahymena thermophila SB210]